MDRDLVGQLHRLVDLGRVGRAIDHLACHNADPAQTGNERPTPDRALMCRTHQPLALIALRAGFADQSRSPPSSAERWA